ncbi:hypothetical protein ACFLUH_03405 [Chloroflexota bacterium]
MKKISLNILIMAALLLIAIPATSCTSELEITSFEVSPSVCFPGEEVTVSATLVNNDDSQGNYMVRLLVDNVLEGTQTMALTPGLSQPLSFALTRTQPGSYSVRIGNIKSTLLVLSASNLAIAPSTVKADEPVTVTADLRNGTDSQVDYHCCLFCQGQEAAAKDITIAANSTETVSFTISQATSGVYEVELLGLSDSFTVLKSAEFEITSLDISPNPLVVGQIATITVGIDNIGEIEGTYEASLLVDGAVEHTWEVTAAPEADTTYEVVTISRDLPGEYLIEAGQRQTTLSVVQPVVLRSGTYIVRELHNGYSKLQIMNRAELDLVVVLTSPEDTAHALIAMYVGADDIYTIQRIPPGIYYLFYVFGEDWDDDAKKFLNSTVYGKGIHYYEFDEKDEKITKWTITFTQDNVEIVSAWNITEEEFPALQ